MPLGQQAELIEHTKGHSYHSGVNLEETFVGKTQEDQLRTLLRYVPVKNGAAGRIGDIKTGRVFSPMKTTTDREVRPMSHAMRMAMASTRHGQNPHAGAMVEHGEIRQH